MPRLIKPSALGGGHWDGTCPLLGTGRHAASQWSLADGTRLWLTGERPQGQLADMKPVSRDIHKRFLCRELSHKGIGGMPLHRKPHSTFLLWFTTLSEPLCTATLKSAGKTLRKHTTAPCLILMGEQQSGCAHETGQRHKK